jgi:hypothetical protein
LGGSEGAIKIRQGVSLASKQFAFNLVDKNVPAPGALESLPNVLLLLL